MWFRIHREYEPGIFRNFRLEDVTAGNLFVQQHVITTIAHKDIVSDILHFWLASPKVCIFQSMNQVYHKLRSVLGKTKEFRLRARPITDYFQADIHHLGGNNFR